MGQIRQVFLWVGWEFRQEFRQKVLTATVFLFVASAAFTLYQVLLAGRARANPLIWSAMFWLVVLFSSFQVTSRGFSRELGPQFWFYYFRWRAEWLMLAKLLYHFLMLSATSLLAWSTFGLLFGNPVRNNGLFLLLIELAALGIASALTLISAISSRAGKNNGLLPVLGFPLLIPTLMLVARLSVLAIDDLGWDLAWRNIWTLLGLDSIMIALSFILFPYLWRQ
jgi:heme exporter protein B